MFGIATEADNDHEDKENEDGFAPSSVIQQIVPADPAWRAAFKARNGQPKLLPVVCFALVEGLQPDGSISREIRPMAADELGRVDDVEMLLEDSTDFICLVPPGADVQTTIKLAQTQRLETAPGET